MELEESFNNICGLFQKEVSQNEKERKETYDMLIELIKDFQNKITEKTIDLNFGFDSLLYSSTLLLFIVIIVIIFNFIKQKKRTSDFSA